jgi:hypothetical protein
MLEDDLFCVDDNYRSLKQVNVNTIRQQRREIYWLLIWYFCTVKLPYEFLIPYEEKELLDEFNREYLSVKRQLFFDEKVEHFGLAYFDRVVKEFYKKQARQAAAEQARMQAAEKSKQEKLEEAERN